MSVLQNRLFKIFVHFEILFMDDIISRQNVKKIKKISLCLPNYPLHPDYATSSFFPGVTCVISDFLFHQTNTFKKNTLSFNSKNYMKSKHEIFIFLNIKK